VLINRLTDGEEEVVVEAAGALRYAELSLCSCVCLVHVVRAIRNLCIDGGYDICAEMYNKNIIVPLQTFIPKVVSETCMSSHI